MTETKLRTLSVYRDDFIGGSLRVLCASCVHMWKQGGLQVPKALGVLNELAQACCTCENCVIVASAEIPQRTYYDEVGTFRNQDGSRSVFDDVDF